MQRRHGGEHVGVASVEAIEDAEAGGLVECAKAGHISGSAQEEVEPVFGHIPWRGGGMYIISGETDEVDQEEYDGEMQVFPDLSSEIEIEAEQYGHRHPAEVEKASGDVHPGEAVEAEIFVGGKECAVGGGYSEEGFFCIVEALYVYGVHFIVVHDVHPVV